MPFTRELWQDPSWRARQIEWRRNWQAKTPYRLIVARYGETGHRLYSLLKHMMDRCSNPNCPNYSRYGAEGIKVARAWQLSPMTFVEWALAHGYERGLLIDRIDNKRGYNPDNCRFVTHLVSAQNRNNRKFCDDETNKRRSETLKRYWQAKSPEQRREMVMLAISNRKHRPAARKLLGGEAKAGERS